MTYDEDIALTEALCVAGLEILPAIPVCMKNYNPGTGVYACANPTYDSTALLLSAIPQPCPFDPQTLREEAHVTLVYSREAPLNIEEFRKSPILDVRELSATVTDVVYWEGHDKNGYVVIKLKSDSLDSWNAALITCGAKHSFPKFEAHLSVCSKVGPMTPAVEQWLKDAKEQLAGLCVCFDTVKIQDIKH